MPGPVAVRREVRRAFEQARPIELPVGVPRGVALHAHRDVGHEVAAADGLLLRSRRQRRSHGGKHDGGCHQQNGRHERMHLTLKKEATRPAGANILQQQAKFDTFLEEFNHERPHEALAMKCPAEVYSASSRPYRGIPDPHYPFHDRTVVVTSCGRLCLYNNKINLSVSLAGQAVGVKEVDNGIWLVSFMNYDLGYIDLEEKTLQPLENPFGPKV